MSDLALSESPGHDRPSPRESPGRRAWRRFRRNRLATGSGLFLLSVMLLVLTWPLLAKREIARHLPTAMTWSSTALSDEQFQPPGPGHWFGTDVHGRDLLSRVFYGARISLLGGIVGAGVSMVIGVLWGAVAGYAGGRVDSAMMRLVASLFSLASRIFCIVLFTMPEGVLE